MYWDILQVQPVAPRTLKVTFSDGLTGTVFIDHSFCVGVFEPLKDEHIIEQAYPKNGAVTWFDELDLAPDTMYHEIKNNPNRHYVISRECGVDSYNKCNISKCKSSDIVSVNKN
jgi:hypothetical protein